MTTFRAASRVLPGALVLGAVAALSGAAPAGALVGAAPADVPAIEGAVRSSPLTAGVDGSRYAVRDVRVSAADPAWAAARLAPVGADLEPAEVVLQQVDGRWEVADLGTAEVGCGVAPEAVLTDLGAVCGL